MTIPPPVLPLALLAALAFLPTSSACAQAEVFAPGVVSDTNVWKGAFEPDGRTLYFFRKVGRGEDYRIFVTRQGANGWSTPERLKIGSGDHSELYPAISPDGQRMVFTTYRPYAGDTASHAQSYLWMSTRRGAGWGEPVPLTALNVVGRYHSQTLFGGDGSLYFRRDSADYRGTATYVAKWNGTTYDAPQPFDPINRWNELLKPNHSVPGGAPAPDMSYIVLEVALVNAQGRRGPPDLWVTCRAGSQWSAPTPIPGDANSPGVENFMFHGADGQRLYYVRDFARLYSIPTANLCPSSRR
ncbi:MAG: PD40 domain-containing protein [Cytophagaceae bacterium]|nr:PD40 domain-containing protein [Gemmatimonadaceae bacterium]